MNPAQVVNKSKLADFLVFAEAQKAACDIDPLYPVLAEVFGRLYDGSKEQDELTIWACIVYVAYYNAASALTALHELPPFGVPEGPLAKLPTGIERRGLRGGDNLTEHLQDMVIAPAIYGSFRSWLTEGWEAEADPEEKWQGIRRVLLAGRYNGRWATYKLAEVLQKVAGWPIAAPDMGMDGASGPKQGLEILFGPAHDVDTCEEQGRWLWESEARALGLDLAEVETCLCDFHSLADGRYYVGHDVGLLYDDVHALPEGDARTELLSAAEATLPSPYWKPLDRSLKRVYKFQGRIEVA